MKSSFTALILLYSSRIWSEQRAWRLARTRPERREDYSSPPPDSWWAILFSVVATETSALTLISIPGLAYLGI